MRQLTTVALTLLLAVSVGAGAGAQHTMPEGRKMQEGHREAPMMGTPKAPVRMTMEELHKHGGVPPGWKFTLPEGDPRAGRDAFVAMKCFTCHDVAGETFPAHKRDVGEVGPGLAGMGGHHPAEYFAEAILNPNSVVVLGEGYTSADGLSRMPDYNDTLTVRQLLDLVAYLKSLSGGHKGPHAPGR